MVALVMAGCSCGRSDDNAEKMMADSVVNISVEKAQQLAKHAAGAIALSDTTDTLTVQRAIIDAYATRSQMVLDGNERAAKAFDKALEEELQHLNLALAAEIFYDHK